MNKIIFYEEVNMVNKDRIEVLLQKLDVEIGSTITFINDEKQF